MEMKTLCIALLLLLATGCQRIAARPQDLESGILMAAAQIKDLIETGAAGNNQQSGEVFGQRMKSNMGLGFGDAIQSMGGRK